MSYNSSKNAQLGSMLDFKTKNIKIDVVLQATGKHTWNMSEGWVNVLRKEGWLNRAFYPIADWNDDEPVEDNGLFDYLKNPQSDLILLLGFDWHSQPLHKTLKWQERWANCPIKKIAIVNEMCSSPIVQRCEEWQKSVSLALHSSMPCVDAVIFNHEPDLEFLYNKENIFKPSIFQPFAIDPEFFSSNIEFYQRQPKAFFRGNVTSFYDSESYIQRQRILEGIRYNNNVCLKEFQQEFLLKDYTNDLQEYQILLNLPSISPTLTARVFESMGCGGVLIQSNIIGQKSTQLFQDWEHLVFYDSDNHNDLIEKVKYLIKNPDIAQRIANNGYHICHQKHTLKCRVEEILLWLNQDFKITNQSSHTSSNSEEKILSLNLQNDLEGEGSQAKQKDPKKIFPTIVIDGVFFQLTNTGIARAWRSLLEEWITSGFARHIVLLDRGKTAPRISGIKYRNIELYNYEKTGIDSRILQFVCDEVGADLFISTYYTTPLSTPSIFMVHDMIPEVVGADLTVPMWQEKRNGILHACRYIAVSQNTATDLVEFYPSISKESITVAYNGISNNFFPAKLNEIINFRASYGILKPYFLMVGNRLNLNSYKNATLFFKALNHFEKRNEITVVCIGGETSLELELAELAKGLSICLLKLDDDELKTAYSGAIALVYPSLYEGFGLPIAEAMACGCPVITCRNSSIPEVAGEAAIYVDEYKVEEMVDALSKVQNPEIRQEMIERGLEQAKQFSWTKMAKTIADVFMTTVEQVQDSKFTQATLIWQDFRKMQAHFQTLSSQLSSQSELQLTQPQSQEVEPIEVQKNPSHEELQRLEIQLKQKQQDLHDAEAEIIAMESSKFWKSRIGWFKIKKMLFPILSLVLGLNLFFLVNSIDTYQPISKIIFWLSEVHENIFLWLGLNLFSITLILGIVGNLGLINSKFLRLSRLILVIAGFILLAVTFINK
jgi:glycosyltransferase involved in cell wall biosynthesis